MRKAHVVISIANLVVLAAFIIGTTMDLPNLFMFGVIGGYFANVVAIVVAFLLVLIVAIRVPSGTALNTFRRQWLGIANGAAVVAIWSIYFVVEQMSWK